MSSIVKNNADEAKNASNFVRETKGKVDTGRESLMDAVNHTIETNERTLSQLKTKNSKVGHYTILCIFSDNNSIRENRIISVSPLPVFFHLLFFYYKLHLGYITSLWRILSDTKCYMSYN